MFAYVIFSLTLLPPTKARPSGGKSIIGDFKLGFQHIASRPRLALLVSSFIGVIMFGFSYQVVMPGFLENELGRDPKELGLLFFAGAVSGLIVTLVVASKAGGPNAWKMMIIGGFILGGALAATAFAQNFWQVIFWMFISGAGASAFQLLNNSLIMQNCDQAYYGRVMSLTMMAWGMNGVVGFPFGLLADATGERPTILLMAALVLAVVTAVALVHVSLNRKSAVEPVALATVAGGE
jgi:MFS family permease